VPVSKTLPASIYTPAKCGPDCGGQWRRAALLARGGYCLFPAGTADRCEQQVRDLGASAKRALALAQSLREGLTPPPGEHCAGVAVKGGGDYCKAWVVGMPPFCYVDKRAGDSAGGPRGDVHAALYGAAAGEPALQWAYCAPLATKAPSAAPSPAPTPVPPTPVPPTPAPTARPSPAATSCTLCTLLSSAEGASSVGGAGARSGRQCAGVVAGTGSSISRLRCIAAPAEGSSLRGATCPVGMELCHG
jgi:hypothetical protein